MNVRPEQPDDQHQIRRVHLQAFDTDTEAKLVDALRSSGVELISLVAVELDEVIGHILFSPVNVDGQNKVMGLAPMAVLPQWQRQGVGAQLVEAGLSACRQAGKEAVVVLGHPAYYPRFGFEPASQHGIHSEYDVPNEAFMVIELVKGSLDGVNGIARYPHVFNEL